MEFSKFIPTLSDLKSLVNESNFLKEDIELQSKIASEVGYDNFEHYLEFQFFIYLNKFHLNELFEEISKDYETQHKIKGNLETKIAKYKDHSIEEELNPIFERVQKLPADIQTRLGKFEDKLQTLYFQSLLDKIAEDDSATNTIKSFLNDLANQYSLTKPEAKQFVINAISYLDGIGLHDTNKLMQEVSSGNYYFPKQVSILQQLHDGLVLGKYIEQNDDFVNVFHSKIKPPHLKSILWLEETPKLFYLLFRLNENKEFIDNQRIDSIAHQLFTFNPEKTIDNIRTAYNKTVSQMNDKLYIDKKMHDLKIILDRILIK